MNQEKECESVREMWNAYLKAEGDEGAIERKGVDAWHFCNNEKEANELLELVLKGEKAGDVFGVLFV